jgi:hypothetical protein
MGGKEKLSKIRYWVCRDILKKLKESRLCGKKDAQKDVWA